MNLAFLYGASKPPLRHRIADRIERAAENLWQIGTLDDDRTMTEIDAALVQFYWALYRLADAVR